MAGGFHRGAAQAADHGRSAFAGHVPCGRSGAEPAGVRDGVQLQGRRQDGAPGRRPRRHLVIPRVSLTPGGPLPGAFFFCRADEGAS